MIFSSIFATIKGMKILTSQNPTYSELQEYCQYLDQKDFGYGGEIQDLSSIQIRQDSPDEFVFVSSSGHLRVVKVISRNRTRYEVFVRINETDDKSSATFFQQSILKEIDIASGISSYTMGDLTVSENTMENNTIKHNILSKSATYEEYVGVFLPLADFIFENSKESLKQKVFAL